MTITELDHFVLTTQNLDACLHFYCEILNMRHTEENGRHALYFGKQKINIHTKKGEFQPAAQHPEFGALDLCFVVTDDLPTLKNELEQKGAEIALGIVPRHGARGDMESLYLYDPDGNLVELCRYPDRKEEV